MSGISDVYTYFRSIGISGQEHTQWVTDSLSLVPKPSLFSRLFGCCAPPSKTSIPKVMLRLDEIASNDVEDSDARNMAAFIKGVLENLHLERDLDLVNLKRLNTLLNVPDHLPRSKASVEKHYLATGMIDEKSADTRRLVAATGGPFQQLSQDMLAKIFSYLSLRDHFKAAATCRDWQRAAARNDSLSLRSLAPEEKLYVSTLRDQSLQGICTHRTFLGKYATGNFKTSILASRFFNSRIPFAYQPKSGDPILIRDEAAIYIGNTTRAIPHNFRGDYVVLYEKSINKIFVLDKVRSTIHGLYEIDPETGETRALFQEVIETSTNFHITFHNNEIWIITRLGSSRVYNRESGELREENWEVKPAQFLSLHHFSGMQHIYTSNGAVSTFEVQNLENPQDAHILPGSEKCYSLIATTPNALYVAMRDHRTVAALDSRTGEILQTFFHPKLFLWSTPAAHVHNGMLYLSTSPFKTHAFDILTGKKIRTFSFGFFERNSNLQIYDNNLVYRVGNNIFINALQP